MTDPTSTPATPTDDEPAQFAVIVTLPNEPDELGGTDPVRRVGPYWRASAAEHAAGSFGMMLHNSAPQGTTVDVGPYDPAVPHLDPYPPTDVSTLAVAVVDEPDGPGGGWSFPDLWARLHASTGYDRARKVWVDACQLADYWAEQDAEERQAAAELANSKQPNPLGR